MTDAAQLPLVSIGLPVYNEENYLPQTLAALLTQDYPNFELTICDNGSTDGTQAICEEVLRSDSRVRYHRSPENRGASWNFQHAFRIATGEFFMWAASHDLWKPNFISACMQPLLRDPEVVLSYPRTQLIDGSGAACQITPDVMDTRKLSRSERVAAVIRNLQWCNLVYGIYRTQALRQCRLGLTCCGPDLVLMMELSLYGSIAQIPDVLFIRREFRPAVSPRETMAAMLLRLDPNYAHQKKVWPYRDMGREHLHGVWKSKLPLWSRLGLLWTVHRTFHERWRDALQDERANPLTFP